MARRVLGNARWPTGLRGNCPKDLRSPARSGARHPRSRTPKEERQKSGSEGPPTGIGYIREQAESIRSSATDPRATKKPKEEYTWNDDDIELYFAKDIAARIHDGLSDTANWPLDRASGFFGRMLYGHFGALNLPDDPVDPQKKRMFALHNNVRRFYQKIARTDRFRIAFTNESKRPECKLLVPRDQAALLAAMGAKSRNSEISAVMRLGKMVAHAIEAAATSDDAQSTFRTHMDRFATSDGQSEIKRAESFTRTWRRSVAFGVRTLDAWAKAVLPARERGDAIRSRWDIAGTSPALAAASALAERRGGKKEAPVAAYNAYLDLVFGAREVLGLQSRSAIFKAEAPEACAELFWGLLRLGGEIRNRVNHFATMGRLLELLERGVLSPRTEIVDGLFRNEKGDLNRGGASVSPAVPAAFKRLLAFDRMLARQEVADELNRLEIRRFVADKATEERLVAHLCRHGRLDTVTTPRFFSLIKHILDLLSQDPGALPPSVRSIAGLRLDSASLTRPGANKFKVGVLRALYGSGFEAWLADRGAEGTLTAQIVRQAIVAKKRRAEAYAAEEKQFYKNVEISAEAMGLGEISSLSELSARLASLSMGGGQTDRNYRSLADEQKKRATWIEKFRRDVFALLLARYLDEASLAGLLEVEDGQTPLADVPAFSAEDIALEQFPTEDWHAAFYAWLYLVPPQVVAELRHQFRKTRALETKAGAAEDPRLTCRVAMLDGLDRLMGLYVKVQGSGFAGHEHLNPRVLGGEDGADSTPWTGFYESPDLAAQLFSQDAEHHNLTFPGTHRGLRQILRFGQLSVLRKIFERHAITDGEVQAYRALNDGDVEQHTVRRTERHSEIVALAGSGKSSAQDRNALIVASQDYQKLAVDLAIYRFQASAARLTEYGRLNALMMRVVARLMDFALLWERDRVCLFLGLLYRRGGDDAFQIARTKGKDSHDRDRVRIAVVMRETPPRSVRVWSSDRGFGIPEDDVVVRLLAQDQGELYRRYFGTLPAQNERDKVEPSAANSLSKRGNHGTKGAGSWKTGKPQIRNDFAHFNVLDGRNGRAPNLTYLTNSVRSLMSYDRKLKNAVSKAIADLLLEEGLRLTWRMDQDRLCDARILPDVETHLGFLRGDLGEELRFAVPKTSVRFTSMAQALFAFEAGGHRATVEEEGEQKRKGELSYPADLWTRDDQPKVPRRFAALTLPGVK